MGEISYAPLIEDMVWSYSRIKAFDDCPYRWYLKYIRHLHSKDMFFSDYGSFVHKLIELYFLGEKTRDELCDIYLREFKSRVKGRAPNPKVFGNYFKSGLNYIRNIAPFPYHMVAVEKRVDFNMNGIPFVGYIDYLGEKDGELYVVDNKSRTLKPRSTRTKPTKTDEELDAYLRQLYIYSAAVEQEYGKTPRSLCFNCFRAPVFVEEPFQEQAYAESKKWLEESVARITAETDFKPDIEYFRCTHLCEMNGHCEYYKLSQKKR